MAIAKHPVDWKAIRVEFENTLLSVRSIAMKYGVPRTTLLGRIRSEHWQRASATDRQQADILGGGPTMTDTPLSDDEVDAVTIAQLGLRGLAQIAEKLLDLREHKLLADALSQYYKILVTARSLDVPDTQARPNYSNYTQEQLDRLLPAQAIIDAVTREVDAEQDEKIIPLHR